MTAKEPFVPTDRRDAVFAKLKLVSGNQTCVDCGQHNPLWASATFGVFVCLSCSGAHRRMGVHVSFVRSIDMDNWTESQLQTMRLGGNANAKNFFRAKGWTDSSAKLDEKYSSRAAHLYKAHLNKLVAAAMGSSTSSPPTDPLDASSIPIDALSLADPAPTSEPAATVGASPAPLHSAFVDAVEMRRRMEEQKQKQREELARYGSPINLVSTPSTDSGSATPGSATESKAAPATVSVIGKARKPTKAGGLGGQKLGASKLAGSVDFSNFEAQAAAAAAQQARETEEQKKRQEAEDARLAKALQQAEESGSSVEVSTPTPRGLPVDRLQADAVAPSMYRTSESKTAPSSGRGGSTPKVAAAAATPEPAAAEVLNRFAGAKSISSDAFFGQQEAAANDDVDRARLQNRFTGAASISSDAFFGRETEGGSGGPGGRQRTSTEESLGAFVDKLGQQVTEDIRKVATKASNFASMWG